MVVANFGMGIRPSSSVIQTQEERALEFERQQAKAAARITRKQDSLQSRAEEFARQNVANTMAMGYELTPQMQANIIEGITPAYLGKNLSSGIGAPNPHTTNAPSPWSAQLRENGELKRLEDLLAGMPAQFEAQERGAASSQASQQGAYNAFNTMPTGGVLGRTSQVGTNDPTQPGATMPWNQPWSQAGYGNPGSLGGLGGYKPNAQQGWGSVFGGGRNPWSLA